MRSAESLGPTAAAGDRALGGRIRAEELALDIVKRLRAVEPTIRAAALRRALELLDGAAAGNGTPGEGP